MNKEILMSNDKIYKLLGTKVMAESTERDNTIFAKKCLYPLEDESPETT